MGVSNLPNEVVNRLSQHPDLVSLEESGVDVNDVARSAFDWSDERRSSKTVVKALARSLQATGLVEGASVSRYSQGIEMLAFASACAPLLDSDRLARLIELAPSTPLAYQPVEDVPALSLVLRSALERFPQERRERLLKDLWVSTHALPVRENNERARRNRHQHLDYYESRALHRAAEFWLPEGRFAEGFTLHEPGTQPRTSPSGAYGLRDRLMGVVVGEKVGEYPEGSAKMAFEALKEMAAALPTHEEYLAGARKSRQYGVENFDAMILLLQIEAGVEQGPHVQRILKDIAEADPSTGYGDMLHRTSRRTIKYMSSRVFDQFDDLLNDAVLTLFSPSTVRILAANGALLDRMVQLAHRALKARPELGAALADLVPEDPSERVREMILRDFSAFAAMVKASRLVDQIEFLTDPRMTDDFRSEILERLETTFATASEPQRHNLLQRLVGNDSLPAETVRRLYQDVGFADRSSILSSAGPKSLEALAAVEDDVTIILEGWGEDPRESQHTNAAWAKVLQPAANTMAGARALLMLGTAYGDALTSMGAEKLERVLDRGATPHILRELTHGGGTDLPDAVWDRAIRRGAADLSVEGNRAYVLVSQGHYTKEDLKPFLSSNRRGENLLAFHPGVAPSERPVGRLLDLAVSAADIVTSGLTEYVPVRPTDWENLIPKGDVVPFRAYSQKIRALDGVALPGTDVQVKLIKSPADLEANARQMGNCTGGYGYRAEDGEWVLFYVVYDDVEVNFSLSRRYSNEWGVEEINSRFNNGGVPAVVRSGAEELCKLLN